MPVKGETMKTCILTFLAIVSTLSASTLVPKKENLPTEDKKAIILMPCYSTISFGLDTMMNDDKELYFSILGGLQIKPQEKGFFQSARIEVGSSFLTKLEEDRFSFNLTLPKTTLIHYFNDPKSTARYYFTIGSGLNSHFYHTYEKHFSLHNINGNEEIIWTDSPKIAYDFYLFTTAGIGAEIGNDYAVLGIDCSIEMPTLYIERGIEHENHYTPALKIRTYFGF